MELRRRLCLQAQIAFCLGVSKATVSRVLKRAGLSKLSDLRPGEPVQRYEREQPGELLHIDIKKLGRFDRVGHRITGDRTQRARIIGWEHLFVAVDDHSRMAFTQVYPDESRYSAEAFLRSAVAYFERLGVPIQRVLTDNGKSFHSGLFAATCLELGISQKFTRAYRPQTNGKAERFIQSALRDWAYGHTYASSDQRRDALPAWNHFYNWHRPHHGINLDVRLLDRPGEALPLPDRSVDCVVMTFTLCTIANALAALALMHRVLRPDGRLLFCERGAAPDPAVRHWQDRLGSWWGRCVGGYHLTRDAVTMITSAGFGIDQVESAYLPGTPRFAGQSTWGAASRT